MFRARREDVPKRWSRIRSVELLREFDDDTTAQLRGQLPVAMNLRAACEDVVRAAPLFVRTDSSGSRRALARSPAVVRSCLEQGCRPLQHVIGNEQNLKQGLLGPTTFKEDET
jgi:hypothetical protein